MKMKMMSRLLASVMAASMVMGCCTVNCLAEDENADKEPVTITVSNRPSKDADEYET